MTIASLAMYPFTHLRSAHDHLWDDVRSRLSFDAPRVGLGLGPMSHLAATTCCWARPAAGRWSRIWPRRYAWSARSTATWRALSTERIAPCSSATPAIHWTKSCTAPIFASPPTARDSLSGWISLLAVAQAEGVQLDAVEWTGAHAVSIEAVRDGRCQLAAIDAVSLAHLGSRGLSIVGHGPRIPCLPLVTSRSTTDAVVSELRGALAASVGDPAMAETCATLKIRGFLERELADYEGVSDLVELW